MIAHLLRTRRHIVDVLLLGTFGAPPNTEGGYRDRNQLQDAPDRTRSADSGKPGRDRAEIPAAFGDGQFPSGTDTWSQPQHETKDRELQEQQRHNDE